VLRHQLAVPQSALQLALNVVERVNVLAAAVGPFSETASTSVRRARPFAGANFTVQEALKGPPILPSEVLW